MIKMKAPRPASSFPWQHALVTMFFLGFLAVGIGMHGDYGIPWDEPHAREYGNLVWNHIATKGSSLQDSRQNYGPAYELLLLTIEKISRGTDPRQFYMLRHLVKFLFFYASVIFFYLLVRNRYSSWRMGLLGSLFLILSPRILADSFFNPYDIPFLSMFIVCTYTMLNYLKKKNASAALLHAVGGAFLIDIRVLGVLSPAMTGLFLLGDLALVEKERERFRSALVSFFLYLCLMAALVVLFWPTLWEKPLASFIGALQQMSRYPWDGVVLYAGNVIKAAAVPWHYIPVWMLITTPPLYTALFLLGLGFILPVMARGRKHYEEYKLEWIAGLWFFFPLLAVMILKSVLYDAWRQLFFVYPALLIIALHGLRAVREYLAGRFKGRARVTVLSLAGAAVAFSVLSTLVTLVRYHPHQNVYFNSLIGGIRGARFEYELDYWGLSFRQALTAIVRGDPAARIPVYVVSPPGEYNSFMLRKKERERLVFVNEIEKARYYVGNYRSRKEEYAYSEEFYAKKIDGVKIVAVYKLPPTPAAPPR